MTTISDGRVTTSASRPQETSVLEPLATTSISQPRETNVMESLATTSTSQPRETTVLESVATTSISQPNSMESLATTSISQPIETNVMEPLTTKSDVTTTDFETTTGFNPLNTDAEAVKSTIPVYVWPIAIIAIVAVIIAIVLAIVIFWKTKRSKYVCCTCTKLPYVIIIVHKHCYHWSLHFVLLGGYCFHT